LIGISDGGSIVGRTKWGATQILRLVAWVCRLSIGQHRPYTAGLIRAHLLTRDPGTAIGGKATDDYLDVVRRLRGSESAARSFVEKVLRNLPDASRAEWSQVAPRRVCPAGYAPGMITEQPCQVDIITGYRPMKGGKSKHKSPWWPQSLPEGDAPKDSSSLGAAAAGPQIAADQRTDPASVACSAGRTDAT
jgi:hypothetical protein